MQAKDIVVAYYGRRFPRQDWRQDVDSQSLRAYVEELGTELAELGVNLRCSLEEETIIEVNGYGDLLNAVRIRSPKDSISNLCLGHIIGSSPNCDLFEDVRRGVNRVAFAPEMVEPEHDNKHVCHNCGCGC